jgi:hypothetical protein
MFTTLAPQIMRLPAPTLSKTENLAPIAHESQARHGAIGDMMTSEDTPAFADAVD